MILECDPVEVVQRQLEAFQAGDLAGFVASYAPDAVVARFAGAPLMTGHDEMRAGYAPSFEDRPFTLTLGGRIVNGQYVIDEEVIAVAGEEIERVIVIYRVDGCLIGRSWLMPPPSEQRP